MRSERRLAPLAAVRLAPAIGAWALILPALKRGVPLQRLIKLMWPGNRRRSWPTAAVVRLTAALPHRVVGRDNCLERSLIAYRYLAQAGKHPRLVVGVRSGADGVEGHVWVTIDDAPVHDRPHALASFEPVAVFGHGGSMTAGSRGADRWLSAAADFRASG